MYVALDGNTVKTYGTTLIDIYKQLVNVRIESTGTVYINGKLHTMSYNMKEYSIREAYDDFYYCYAKNHIGNYIGIYKSI